MIWATVPEVRDYLELDDHDPADTALQRDIDRAERTLEPKCVRLPLAGDDDRAVDVDIRGHLTAAVAELIDARRKDVERDASLGGHADIIDRGGSIDAGTLKVAGAANRTGTSGYGRAALLPLAVLDALQAAGVVGGSVPAW